MTPRELDAYARAYNQRMEDELEKQRQSIYLTALLTARFVWSKHRPSYEKVFGVKRQRREMSDQEMLNMVVALNAMFGGADTRGE